MEKNVSYLPFLYVEASRHVKVEFKYRNVWPSDIWQFVSIPIEEGSRGWKANAACRCVPDDIGRSTVSAFLFATLFPSSQPTTITISILVLLSGHSHSINVQRSFSFRWFLGRSASFVNCRCNLGDIFLLEKSVIKKLSVEEEEEEMRSRSKSETRDKKGR